MMESNAAVTEALGDFIARVKREKHVLAPFRESLRPKEPQLLCSGTDRPLYPLFPRTYVIIPRKAGQGQLA